MRGYLRRATRVMRAVLGVLLVPVLVQAQGPEQPALFVHGLLADGPSWAVGADNVRRALLVQPYLPSLTWYAPFEIQSAELIAYAQNNGLPPNTIAITHSNGGLVSRSGFATGLLPVRGIITVGTPHRGVQLATSVAEADPQYGNPVVNELERLTQDVAIPLDYYADIAAQEQYHFGIDLIFLLAAPFADALQFIVDEVAPRVQTVLGFASQYTVVHQMEPGSQFLEGADGVNAPARLADEAASGLVRVGIFSQVASPYGIVWRALQPEDYFRDGNIQYGLATIYLSLFDYYVNYPFDEDPYWFEKRDGAYLWLLGAADAIALDEVWCIFIGAYEGGPGCVPSDAVVPVASQRFPGDEGATLRNLPMYGPAHLEEKSSGELAALLNNFVLPLLFNVQQRP